MTVGLLMLSTAPALTAIIPISGRGLTGIRSLSRGVAVPSGLNSFSFNFENGDHHIKGITALPNDLRTTVGFIDNDGNDPYQVSLQVENDLGAGARSVFALDNRTCNGGTCRVRLPIPCGSQNTFVLTGFSFQFKDGDHQIKKVAIKRIEDELEVSFGDKTPTDPYVWSVQYAIVPRANLASEQTIRRPTDGSARVARLPGRAVIQGFSFEFTRDDHHLRDFKVDLQNNQVAINFRDNNLDDPVNWSVDYGVLR
ncbi:hypothetical protein NC981_03270 [Leptolyngbya sp. DQ-M1]|uniref:hypothetical protein n=1 Tax=Leptolyngbya sp. DQ-M1 TaxID=2933920 RepID=UPI003297AE22